MGPESRPAHTGLRVFISFAVLILAVVPLGAQTVSGTVQGMVAGPDGSPLPGVTVTLRNVDTGHERVVLTNEAGLYRAPYLPLGTYDVVASLDQMGTASRRGVAVTLNHTSVVDFAMGMQVSESITVAGDQPRINRVNSEIKSSLTAQEVIDKPTAPMAGPFAMLSLVETFAGFQENPTSGQNNPTLSSGSSVNFGTGTRGTTFQINGVNNDDSSENQHRQGVPLSTIKEFQILTNNFSAEFGRGHGGVLLVQTKSGTNDLAGDLYGFLSDGEWNSKSYFSRQLPKPINERTVLGFTSGFPLMRDRLFGFVNYEENSFEGEGAAARDIFIPSDLTVPRLTRGNDTPENRAWQDSILARFPQVAPNDPRSNRTYGYLFNLNQPDEDYSARLDFDLNSSHHFTTRYQYSHQIRETSEVIIGEQAKQDNEQDNFGLTWTHVLSDRFVGEARYGLGVRSTNANIAAGNDTPVVRFTGTPVAGSIIGNAGAFPIIRDQKDHQFVYNMSAFLLKDHTFRAGADIRRQELDDRADNFHRGFWNFNRVCGGTTYETVYHAFMDGCVATFQKSYGPNFLENRINEENFYVEDNWQVRPSLILNLGVRYERVSAPDEVEDRIDYGFDSDEAVDPRVGFAYTIDRDLPGYFNWLTGGANNAVLRGGYGTFHGRVFQSIFSQGGASVRTNPPDAAFLSFTQRTNLADPTNGFVFTPGVAPTVRISQTLIDPDLGMPKTDQWNLTFERNMPWNSSIRLTYANKKGSDLLRYVPTNLPLSPLDGPVTVADHPFNAPAAGFPDLRGRQITAVASDWRCAGTGLPGIPTNATCPNAVPIGDNEISLRVPRTNERRPDPRYTTNLTIINGGESEYESIQLEWVKRFSNDLHFQASYTYAEEFDNVSEATFVGAGDTNQTGPKSAQYAWAPSRFSTPHRFTFYGSYHLPFFKDRKDWLGYVLGGWQIAPVYRFASGTPFTVTSSAFDLDFDGFSESRPVLLDPSIVGRRISNPDDSASKLVRDAFRNPVFGDGIEDLVGRNAFWSDDMERLDVGLYKNFSVAGMTLVLRGEAFNVLNKVTWGFPVTDINNANFGRILTTHAAYQPRTFQVGLRLLY